jgi:hypothetical protein
MLIDTQRKFDAFRHHLVREPWRGKQVRRLIVIDCFMEDMNKSKLYALLPNLQTLFLEHTNIPNRRIFRIELPTRNSLKYVYDGEGRFELTHSLLISGISTMLRVLRVALSANNRYCAELTSLLRRAPHLKDLRIENADISIYDLECLHTNVPLLECLFLPNVAFVMESDNDVPEEIVPAMSMTLMEVGTFDLDNIPQIQWFCYIREKYINLKEFRYICYANRDVHNVDKLNKLGFLPLVHCLGPQLKVLYMAPTQVTPKTFKMFDKYGCRFERLFMLPQNRAEIQHLANSNQARYLQTLDLGMVDPFPPKLLKKFVTLKELRLDYRHKEVHHDISQAVYYPVYHADIFNNCPKTVHSVDIRNAQIECGGTCKQADNIKQLTLMGCMVDPDFDMFMTCHVPNLTSLTLIGFDPMDLELDLGFHDLLYLSIRPNDTEIEGDYRNLVRITTLDDAVTRVYDGKKYYGSCSAFMVVDDHPFDYSVLRPRPHTNKKVGHSVCTIVCASLKTLVINDHPVC